MSSVFVTTREGSEIEVDATPGVSIMEALRNAGVDELLAICGGACSCATCHVYVSNEFLEKMPARSADETELLSTSEHTRANSRLSCQITMQPELDRMRVTVAPEN
jgi:ferredoxin